MKREILFRGKRVDNGEWVYGDLIQFEGAAIAFKRVINSFDENKPIYVEDDVFPESVGQFTGLTDKNVVKIFEGDILTINNKQSGLRSISSYQEYQPKEGGVFYVKATIAGFMLCANKDCEYVNEHHNIDNYSFWNNSRSFIVSGNIHENPELIKITK